MKTEQGVVAVKAGVNITTNFYSGLGVTRYMVVHLTTKYVVEQFKLVR